MFTLAPLMLAMALGGGVAPAADTTGWSRSELQILGNTGSIVDSSPLSATNVVTASAGVSITSAKSKWGTTSMYLTAGTGSIAASNTAPAFMYPGDYEISFYMYLPAYPTSDAGFVYHASTEAVGRIIWILNTAGRVYANRYGSSSTGTSAVIPLNTWVHITLGRINQLMVVSIAGASTVIGADAGKTGVGNSISISSTPSAGYYINSLRVQRSRTLYKTASLLSYTPHTEEFSTPSLVYADPVLSNTLAVIPLDSDALNIVPGGGALTSYVNPHTYVSDAATLGSGRFRSAAGNNMILTLPYSLDNENWTYEERKEVNSFSGDVQLIWFLTASLTYALQVNLDASGIGYIYHPSIGFRNFSGAGLVANVAYDITLQRCGKDIYLYINGVLRSTIGGYTASNGNGTGVYVAMAGSRITYCDDARFTLGNRYSGAYAPPIPANRVPFSVT